MEKQEEKVKIVRYSSLSLRKYIKEEKDSASLQWSTRGMYPRITVYTSNNNAFVNNKLNYDFVITAPFDIITLQMFINLLKQVCKDESNTRYTIDCLNTRVVNGVRTNEKYVQAKVIIGKDDNGIIYIAATEDNKKRIKFTLLPNLDFFKFYNKDGSIIKDPATLSVLYTEAYIKSIETLLVTDTLLLSKKETDVDKPNISRQTKSVNYKSYGDELTVDSSKLQDIKVEKPKETVTETPTPSTSEIEEDEVKEPNLEDDSVMNSIEETTPSDDTDFLDEDMVF